jgi:hypothetical protein
LHPSEPRSASRRLPPKAILFLAAAAVLILIIVATAVIGTLEREDQLTVGADGSLAEATYPASSGEASTDASEPLLATVTQIGDGDECRSFVFDAESGEQADSILDGLSYYSDGAQLAGDMLTAGAYVTSGTAIYLNLQSDLPQQVTVYGIRAEIVTVEEPVTNGTFIWPPTCGGEPVDRMRLLLNAPDQGPYLLDDAGERTDREFFEEQVIQIAAGNKQSVQVDVRLDRELDGGAFEFRLVIDYEFDGEIGSLTIDHDGEPFRVTSFACPQERLFGQPNGVSIDPEARYLPLPIEDLCPA